MSEPNDADSDEHMGPLDEPMRARLASLAPGPSALNEAARERVIAAAVRAGRHHLAIRRVAWAAAVATPLAAAAALWLGRPPVVGPLSTPACAHWAAVPPASLALGPQSLGPRGIVAPEADSAVRMGASDACRTEIVLERGGVVVRADDLGGGELYVLAGDHRVRVTGTLFAVRRSDRSVEVEVVEGRVRVDESSTVGAGQRLVLGGAVEALDPARAQALRAELTAIEPPPPEAAAAPPVIERDDVEREGETPAPSFDPDRLALDAERAYRAGDLDAARASFRRAGAGSEAALVRWARLELDAGHLSQAQSALDLHRRRYGRPTLGAEAQYLRVEIADARHDDSAARAAAESLLERYPDSPQARAARRRLAR